MAEPRITVKGTKMTIEVDLDTEGEPSASGKTVVLASTRGNKKIETDRGEVFAAARARGATRNGAPVHGATGVGSTASPTASSQADDCDAP